MNPAQPYRQATPAPVKPRALRPGANLAVLSPAGSPNPDRVHAGLAHLQRLGYRTTLGPHALHAGPLYYAGTLRQRLADLLWAFTDPAVDAVLCTRGGWGSAELLPHLDPGLFRHNPKPFVGFSDITSLQTWLSHETGLVTFYGPMVSADFARKDGVDLASWHSALSRTEPWSLTAQSGLRILRTGVATGTLRGGCLAILAESLGTPFAPQPATAADPAVLFLEDVNVKPYQWDRMLLHLRLAGQLDHVTGIIFGDMTQCHAKTASPADHAFLEAAILHALHDFSGPIAIGLPSGHVDVPNITLPLGVRVTLDCADAANPAMHFLEAAVSP